MSKLLQNMLLIAGALPRGEGDNDIQTGENGDTIGTGNSARVALLNNIGDNADEARREEMAEVTDADFDKLSNIGQDDDAEAQAAAAELQAEVDRQAAADAAAHSDAPKPIIRKVNGVDVEITDELLAKASKIASADLYLAEASTIRKDVIQSAAQTTAQAEQDSDNTALAEAARAIQMGTEEEAVAALRKIIQKAPPAITADDISRVVNDQLTFKEAIDKFNSDFKDITDDPVLKSIAQDRDAAMLRAGDKRSYYERYSAIGTELREWVSSKAPAATPAPKPQENKLDRKANAPTPPQAAGGKFVPVVEEDKEESTSDVIAAMAAKRGGPQWMGGQTQR